MNAAATIERFFQQTDIAYARVGDDRFVAQLHGERKLSIPLAIAITGREVRFESFFMRRPQDNHDRFYEMLLRRNMRAHAVAFALDAIGDVYLIASCPISALDDDEFDRIVGAFLIESDGIFDAAIAVGFERYLEADMAWRARVGTPPIEL